MKLKIFVFHIFKKKSEFKRKRFYLKGESIFHYRYSFTKFWQFWHINRVTNQKQHSLRFFLVQFRLSMWLSLEITTNFTHTRMTLVCNWKQQCRSCRTYKTWNTIVAMFYNRFLVISYSIYKHHIFFCSFASSCYFQLLFFVFGF